jgi:acyl-CoA synthetase (AMP-forming)/AMP-acid ligase II
VCLLAAAGSAGEYQWQSYQQVARQVEALGRAMAAAGVRAGSRVGVFGVNSPEWVMVSVPAQLSLAARPAVALSLRCARTQAMLACNITGAVCVPLYDTLGPGSVSHAVSHSGMVLAFVQDSRAADLAAALAGLALPAGQPAGAAAGGAAAAAEPAGPAAAAAAAGGGSEVGGGGHQVALAVVWGSGGREEGAQLDEAASELQRAAAGGGAGVEACSWGRFLGRGAALGGTGGGGGGPAPAGPPPCRPEDPATIMYTSGTTGGSSFSSHAWLPACGRTKQAADVLM